MTNNSKSSQGESKLEKRDRGHPTCLSNLAVFSTPHFVCFDTSSFEPRRQLEPKA